MASFGASLNSPHVRQGRIYGIPSTDAEEQNLIEALGDVWEMLSLPC